LDARSSGFAPPSFWCQATNEEGTGEPEYAHVGSECRRAAKKRGH